MSKYKAKKLTIDCVTFDSKIEAKYYEKLKEDQANGLIINFELQPEFELQAKFEKNGKKYRAIKYRADFSVLHNHGNITIIDIKGMATPEAKLKRKLFEFKYDYQFLWIVWYQSKWMNYDDALKIKVARKKVRLLKL